MYYTKRVEDKIRLPPAMFGSKVEDAILRILRERYERRILKDLGFVLSADGVEVRGDGTVIPGDSGAYYNVAFDLLVFVPHVNEVYLGDVKEVVEFGGFVSLGPLQGLLHVSQISKAKFFYDKRTKSLSSQVEKRNVKKGDTLLFKVSTVSMKSTTTETKIGLTMRPDGLGKPEWLDAKAKKDKKPVPKKKEEKK